MPQMTRALLAGGPASLTLNGKTIFLLDDSRLAIDRVTSVITSALYGDGDEVGTDLVVKGSGTPMLYDIAGAGTMQALFPFSTVAANVLSIVPTVGQSIFGMSLSTGIGTATEVPAVWLSPNGDKITLINSAVTKPPDLQLGTNKPIFGAIEISGIISATVAAASGYFNPLIAGAYYTTLTGQTYTAPALDTTSLGRGSYTAAWAGNTLTSFQTQEGFTITHELKLAVRQAYGGLTCDIVLESYRVMCKCIPVGSATTMLAIQTAQLIGGAVGSVQGQRLGQAASNLTLTGASGGTDHSPVVTINNASLKTAGFVFGAKPLRNGEIGWVSTWGTAGPAGTTYPVLMTMA